MITSTDLLIRISVVLLHHYFIFAQLYKMLWWLFALHLSMGHEIQTIVNSFIMKVTKVTKKMSLIFWIQTPLNRQPSSIYNKPKWFMSPRQFCLINTFISYNLAIYFSNSRSMILFHYLFGKKYNILLPTAYFISKRCCSADKLLIVWQNP